MSDYRHLDYSVLVEMLMERTSAITKLIGSGIYSGEEFSHCKETIESIQAEIRRREPRIMEEGKLFKMDNDSHSHEATS